MESGHCASEGWAVRGTAVPVDGSARPGLRCRAVVERDRHCAMRRESLERVRRRGLGRTIRLGPSRLRGLDVTTAIGLGVTRQCKLPLKTAQPPWPRRHLKRTPLATVR